MTVLDCVFNMLVCRESEREQERARESKREQERARESKRERERARESEKNARESERVTLVACQSIFGGFL